MKRFSKKTISISLLITTLLLMGSTDVLANSRAMSIGTKYTDIDTSSSAKYAYDAFDYMGYTSYVMTKPTYSYIKGSHPNGTKRLESEAMFFAGHANYNNITWDYNGNGGDYACGISTDINGTSAKGNKYVALDRLDLSDTRFIGFFGCKTAKGSSNLLTYAIDSGARSAIGWKESVVSTQATKWRNRFMDGLEMNMSIRNAREYADGFSYTDDAIYSSTIKGLSSTVVSKNKRSYDEPMNFEYDMYENNIFDISISRYTLEENVYYSFDNNEIDEVIKYIVENEIDPNFDISNYEVKYYDEDKENGLILFKFLKDGIITNTEIKVFVADGIINNVVVNGEIDYEPIKASTRLSIDEEVLKEMAIQDAGYPEDKYVVIEQRVEERYNIESNEYYYYVKTEFELVDYDTYVAEEFILVK